MKRTLLMLAAMLVAANAAADRLIIATSDYETANTAVYDTESGVMQADVLGHADQDIHVVADGNYVYFIESGLGAVSKYPADDISPSGLVYQYSVGAGSNPVDMVFAGNKAYVLRYNTASILVVNPAATNQGEFELGDIDLGGFDDDGVPDMIDGFVYDGRLYVVLQRLTNWTPESNGLVVAIDTATDTVIDLDAETPGAQGLELLVKNPWWCSQVGETFYISGHLWDGSLDQGVVALDADGGNALQQRMALSEAALGMPLTGLAVFDDTFGLFYSSQWVEEGSEWREVGSAIRFNPTTGETGAALPVPSPGGGVILTRGIIHTGSRDIEAPGLYCVDALTNELVGTPLSTDLPPIAMVHVGDGLPTAVDSADRPEPFELLPVYPNPFNPVTRIEYTLAESSKITIEIRDVTGRKVATLVDEFQAPGRHSVVWHADSCATGLYIVRMSDGKTVRTAKGLLMK